MFVGCALPCHASLNRTCIILGCASCHVYVMFVYHVVCFFPVVLLLDSSAFDAIVRIRSTMIGSSSSWTRSSSERDFRQDDHELGYLYYLCLLVVSLLSLCHASYHIYVSLLYAMIQPLTTLTQQTIVWLCYRFAQPLL